MLGTKPTATPRIASAGISNAKSSTTWIPGHWTSYSRSGVWVSGYYATTTSYNVTLKLAKAVKGARGCEVKFGGNVVSGKLSNGGKTIKFVGFGGSIGGTQSFKVRMLANPGYENNLVGNGSWSGSASGPIR